MPKNSLKKLFLASLSTFSISQVWGKDYFNGVLNQKLSDLLQCNFIAYYNAKVGGPNPNAFLDFVEEPEQFQWFVENYLSVPFKAPQHLSFNGEHDFKPCSKKKWMSEFLKEYEEPDISYLAKSLDNEQRHYYKTTFGDIEPVGKYAIFEVKEFDSYCILPPLVQTTIKDKNTKEYLSFQMDRTDYQIYLEMMGGKLSAMKHLCANMDYSEKKEVAKAIAEANNENSFKLVCPSYYLKLHYNAECKTKDNILSCIDDHIKNSCLNATKNEENPSICDHLINLFNSLRDYQIESFHKFLTTNELSFTKPKEPWVKPLFYVYSRKDLVNPNKQILSDAFKELKPKNKIYFSFSAEIPSGSNYVDNTQSNFKLGKKSSNIFVDAFQKIFSIFKRKSPSIPYISVKELSHKIDDFDFKTPKAPIQCMMIKKTLDLSIEVDIFKVAGAENICSVIEKYALSKDSDFKKTSKDKKLQKLDKIQKGFHVECILISTHIEAYNLIRQYLNLENVLSLVRYTSLYLHKFFKTVTSLKDHFLYNNMNAIKYAKSCGTAVLHVPSVLYRRNIYVPETFLSLYLGLSNLVLSNPSSPFFEYSIMDFFTSYFNKGTKKFIYYFISVISILHINRYYYEQIYCHHDKYFEALKSKMIHPDIVNKILEKIKSILNTPRYSKMLELYNKLEDDKLFDYDEMVKILKGFDEFAQNKDVQERAQRQIDNEEKPEIQTLEDMAKYNEEWLPKFSPPTVPYDDKDHPKPNPNIKFDENIRSDDNLTIADRDKELELELFRYIGTLKESKSTSDIESQSESDNESQSGSNNRSKTPSDNGSNTDLAFDEQVKPTDVEEMKTASKEYLNRLSGEDNDDETNGSNVNEEDNTPTSEPYTDEDKNLL
ncbi:high molecular weight rhoptry protein 3, putative [Plasmodium yoelii]|uniref:High molecular weight rhoptry protein 3 n=4 Tax=Plasmodium yoelii TaxID=5861 RepID=A0AAE9WKS7_PLAYO|nr:high molecular weight rhoptry protein 3, putative [Plasmodium yoelii]WBY55406.1 high molecular weight rhoptry protein 3 [Plasmodium yoelii yoelii]CDU16563.1 high molecular weight rhoptry protein 3, putative [Plasmodium yoelii]VTZ73468.1 high molecular weight rhoptry protein 3, putative [Plasmodium yoelii]|eukprot:XP_022811590.1 high molecular weight rhoptry protein 3, putative [Plasmodium yoelii]